MKINLILTALFVFAFTTFGQAQNCGSSEAKATSASWTSHDDIVDLAIATDDLSTLVAAVKTADLVSTLKSEGPFTVFAPLNSGFAKLPDGTVETLLKPESKGALTNILTYHVVAGTFKANDVINAIKANDGQFTVPMVNGGELVASLSGGSVILTDENGGRTAVVKTDIVASNGVVHIIDSVVLPK